MNYTNVREIITIFACYQQFSLIFIVFMLMYEACMRQNHCKHNFYKKLLTSFKSLESLSKVGLLFCFCYCKKAP